MTESELKAFLDAFVEEKERDFIVVFSPRKTRRRHGSYNAALRRIKIYPRILPQPIDLVGTGLHELAHHLVWESSAEELVATLRKTKRFPVHGYSFKTVLSELVEIFNERHAERFQGFLVLEKGEARYGPEFVEFATMIASTDFDHRAVMMLYTAVFGWRPKKKSSVEHASVLTPIEAETCVAKESKFPASR